MSPSYQKKQKAFIESSCTNNKRMKKRSLAAAIFLKVCESFLLGWSKQNREYFGLYEIFSISKKEKIK